MSAALLLTHESDKDKARRVAVGEACICAAAGVGVVPADEGDRFAFAVDAVSDILTAVFGPQGAYTAAGEFVAGDATRDDIETFLRRSLESWAGDAEDYILEGEAV